MEDLKRQEAIKDIYSRVLNREVDAGGLRAYYDSNLTVKQIEETISCSEEALLLKAKEIQKEGFLSLVEPWLYIGAYVDSFKKELLKENEILFVLDITNSENSVFLNNSEVQVETIKIPNNAVMSISDSKKCLSFINKAYKEKDNVLICDSYGCIKAPAIVVLWYIATGMDLEAAKFFVSSKVSIISMDEMLLGPWHVSAAESFLSEGK